MVRHAWERLGLLRFQGGVIALHGLLWPDEVRDPAAMVPPPVQLDEDEIDEAMALIEAMTRDDLTGPEFTDRYTEALHAEGPGGAQRDGCARGAGQARKEAALPESFLEELRARGRSARYASALTCRGRGHGRGGAEPSAGVIARPAPLGPVPGADRGTGTCARAVAAAVGLYAPKGHRRQEQDSSRLGRRQPPDTPFSCRSLDFGHVEPSGPHLGQQRLQRLDRGP